MRSIYIKESKDLSQTSEQELTMLFGFGKKSALPTPQEALPGRAESMPVPSSHYVNGNPLKPPY
ncbi:MAG TPA: hypothetical protein V6C95_06795, partial [Coleofasciculaceae cyanobacterium]